MRTIGVSEIVAISQIPPLDSQSGAVLSADFLESRWYAAYTCANHEKRVREQLEQRSVEAFLPVYETVRRWKDRRVRLQLPLFPGYLFVRMAVVDRLRVLQVPGVVRLVGFNGQLAALPDEEIEALKKGLAGGVRAEPHPFLTVGRRVRVKRGPFEGRQGILLRRKGKLRLVLSIELIMRSVVIDVDIADVEPEDARQSGSSRVLWNELTMRGSE
jgi:transcription antitermination factor NusG